jgi:hypothetical protein
MPYMAVYMDICGLVPTCKLYVLSALRHLYNLPTMTASKSFLYPKL